MNRDGYSVVAWIIEEDVGQLGNGNGRTLQFGRFYDGYRKMLIPIR